MSFIFKPSWQAEGAGAKVLRIIGGEHLKELDPFLMLDYAKVRLPGGFPDHPHRGFETISYMKQGSFYHEDFKGHRGVLGPGDVQWMTAGRGIVHSEMPGSWDQDSVGFQLWLNLRSEQKMKEPHYQQYRKNQIPVHSKNGAQVTLICGHWHEKQGPINYNTPAFYMGISLVENGTFEIEIKPRWNAMIFIYEGSADYYCEQVHKQVKNLHCCVLLQSENKQLVHKFTSKQGAKFMLIAGEPINEPVVRYGPFVMNTQQQIEETMEDYKKCRNGFEPRATWTSKIKRMAQGVKYEEL